MKIKSHKRTGNLFSDRPSAYYYYYYYCSSSSGAWGSVVVGGSEDRSPVVSLGIFSEATNGTTCPGVDSASRNEYQETPGGKGGR
jgi:hypothetical protein